MELLTMKKIKVMLCLTLSLGVLLSLFTFGASAKYLSSPVVMSVEWSAEEVDTLGVIHVEIELENITDKDIRNVAISSGDSKGVVYFKTVDKNVLISHPGNYIPMCYNLKSSAATPCLKAHGKIRYSYNLVLSYQQYKNKVCEQDAKYMLNQHKLLKTAAFTPVSSSVDGQYVGVTKNLYFGDFKTLLDIKAFVGLSDVDYSIVTGTYTAPDETTDEY